jgi:hypothetical protein
MRIARAARKASPPKSSAASCAMEGDLHVFPLDDISHLPPEVQASIEEGEAEIRVGRVVSHARVQRSLKEMRLRR